MVWNPETFVEESLTQSEFATWENSITAYLNHTATTAKRPTVKDVRPYFLNLPEDTVQHTIAATTAYGGINSHFPMRNQVQSMNPVLQRRRLPEGFATDTFFSTVTSYEGYNAYQIFYGLDSHSIFVYGLGSEKDGPNALLDFFKQVGVPPSILRDNSKMQMGKVWTDYMRRYWSKDKFTQPYKPSQNRAEFGIGVCKGSVTKMMITTGCAPQAWAKAIQHAADLDRNTAKECLGWRTPIEKLTGQTPDISNLIKFKFWDVVLYHEPTHKFPGQAVGGNERLGRWLGRALDHGDGMCSWILTLETEQLIVRYAVRKVEGENISDTTRDAVSVLHKEDRARTEEAFCPVVYTQTGEKDPSTKPGEEPNFKAPPAEVPKETIKDLFIWDRIPNKKGVKRDVKGQIKEVYNDDDGSIQVRVKFKGGKQKIYEYEEIVKMLTKSDDAHAEYWDFDMILDHKWSKQPGRQGKIDVKVKWSGFTEDEATWEPMEVIRKDSPTVLAEYAALKGIVHESRWKWAHKYLKNRKKFLRIRKQWRLMKKRTGE
ncbi:unknown protein [Seminavis robusta]|uniref:Chromo domain-containing protein n=1 Tax=Seminavis robusta TaxID=568900 RepID=A0A9N8F3Y4_9STRA|nr:unknown protein [Seminavis robusta]|eukprot:Sro2752_g336240.1 n/a (542) ;mRNA; r:5155-6905